MFIVYSTLTRIHKNFIKLLNKALSFQSHYDVMKNFLAYLYLFQCQLIFLTMCKKVRFTLRVADKKLNFFSVFIAFICNIILTKTSV